MNYANFMCACSRELGLIHFHLVITGKLVDYYVQERITLNWSSSTSSSLIWTHGKKTLYYLDSQHPVYSNFDDISIAIMSRAQKKYGLYVSVLFVVVTLIQHQ